jgi:5'-methylthioadenosine phosphorylase
MNAVLFVSHGTPMRQVETPFGPAPAFTTPGGLTAFLRTEGQDARARVWAAKDLGATAILAAEVVEAVSDLLEPGDLIVPADVIDQTKFQPHTFFVGKGYGFIQMAMPFCPHYSAEVYYEARRLAPRTFQRAVYTCLEGPRALTEAERQAYRSWGAHLAGTALLPELTLARELELCYAALTIVAEFNPRGHRQAEARLAAAADRLVPILERVALGPSPDPAVRVGEERSCPCAQALARAKASGVVGPDWKSWVGGVE